jgi:hypothetical protein
LCWPALNRRMDAVETLVDLIRKTPPPAPQQPPPQVEPRGTLQ